MDERDYKALNKNKQDNKIQLSDYAKKKLEYINGHCIARDFPNNKPTLEWAGAVLDLLQELGLDC